MPADEDASDTVDPGVTWQTADTRHVGTPTADEQAGLVDEVDAGPVYGFAPADPGSESRSAPRGHGDGGSPR